MFWGGGQKHTVAGGKKKKERGCGAIGKRRYFSERRSGSRVLSCPTPNHRDYVFLLRKKPPLKAVESLRDRMSKAHGHHTGAVVLAKSRTTLPIRFKGEKTLERANVVIDCLEERRRATILSPLTYLEKKKKERGKKIRIIPPDAGAQ